MSVIKCHQQFRAAAKMHWKPDAGLPARGLEVHFGMDGTSISRGQKQQSCGKSAKPTKTVCGLSPERTERAAAKCTGSPMQACLQEGWKCVGCPDDGTSISRGQKQQKSRGKSAKPTGLRPEPGTYGKSSSKMHWKPDAGLPARELEVHF